MSVTKLTLVFALLAIASEILHIKVFNFFIWSFCVSAKLSEEVKFAGPSPSQTFTRKVGSLGANKVHKIGPGAV